MKIKVGDAVYHVFEAGDGEPLLLLHGFTGSVENWSYHMQTLAQHFRVIAVDLPGHGDTKTPDDIRYYEMDHTAADLIILLDKLTLKQVHLAGYSMGGRLALYLAVMYPYLVSSLILESASPGLKTDEERKIRCASDEALAVRIEQDGIETFVNEWERLSLFATQAALPDATRASVRQLRLRNRAEGLANSLRGMGTGVQPSLWNRLSELAMPVLLLSGALDIKFTEIARQMHSIIPHAIWRIILDAGHTIHLEQPIQFDQAVIQFISDIVKTKRADEQLSSAQSETKKMD